MMVVSPEHRLWNLDALPNRNGAGFNKCATSGSIPPVHFIYTQLSRPQLVPTAKAANKAETQVGGAAAVVGVVVLALVVAGGTRVRDTAAYRVRLSHSLVSPAYALSPNTRSIPANIRVG
jgi:hypothetical protein